MSKDHEPDPQDYMEALSLGVDPTEYREIEELSIYSLPDLESIEKEIKDHDA